MTIDAQATEAKSARPAGPLPGGDEADTPRHDDTSGGSRAPLAIALIALAAAVSAPYWSPALYRSLHLRPPAAEWQARQEVETGRLVQSVADLDRRVGELAAALAKANDQAAAAKAAVGASETRARVLVLMQLRAALRRPVPFDAELKAVRALGGRIDELEPLLAKIEPYAANGILVESQLRQEFAAVTDVIGRADPRSLPLKWLSNATGWTPVPVEPDAIRPIAAAEHAQALLSDDNLTAAVEELGALDISAGGPARVWLDEARARITANQAIDRIAEMIATTIPRLPPRP